MKQQNVELLQTLYEEYQGALRYTATRIGVNSDDVDDVIQDSFCAFIKAHGDTIDQWEIARQKGAIMRILKNRCVDYFRIKSRRGVSISLDEGYYGKEVPLPESLIRKDVLDHPLSIVVLIDCFAGNQLSFGKTSPRPWSAFSY